MSLPLEVYVVDADNREGAGQDESEGEQGGSSRLQA